MQARLRAQLGDRSKYSGERRRRSVVVASIVLTITDPLRGSYPFWYYLQAALIRSCGASFACMELTIISRFQRLQASTNSLLRSLFLWFFSAFAKGMSLRDGVMVCLVLEDLGCLKRVSVRLQSKFLLENRSCSNYYS